MNEEFIYVISTQRGQGSPEIYSFWNTYEGAIKAYYQFVINKGQDHFDTEFTMDHYFLCKFPINTSFANATESSDVKLQKSSKYRVKFKSFNDLKEQYNQILRGQKLERVCK